MPYQDRLSKLQSSLSKHEIDALIIDELTDIFYLTGLAVSLGRILVTKKEAFFLVDGRYIETCKQKSPIPTVLAADHALVNLLDKTSPQISRLGFDDNSTTYASYQRISKNLDKKCKNKVDLIPTSSPLKSIRLIKDSQELIHLQKAADLGSQGFDYARSLLQLGIQEIDIANEVEIFWKKNGAEKPAFEINISFGENSAMPHHRAGTDKLQKNQIVLMDMGVTLKRYNSDMTRTLFYGEGSDKLKEIYEIVKTAQATALNCCKPGTTLGNLDQVSRQVIEDAGFGSYYTHSLGHGIGLEVHESPIIRNLGQHAEEILQPGMAVTIEPGIYLPGEGGVRIEDTILITETGHLNLSQRTKDLTQIKI
ncbi:Uncharacterized peptidase YqhT [Chlamydiales bacterium SCGC AG-110-M15]|nr:Uncharacterized peptidase YqhT [Chlamydiales bacterium SCGC AG-110-M15]